MQSRLPVTSLFALIAITLFVLGCAPRVAAGYPEAAGEDDEEAEGVAQSAVEQSEDARPIVQARVDVAQSALPAGFTGFPRRSAQRFTGSFGGYLAPDAPAPTTGPVLDGGKLGHDPQVAASDRFLIVYTAHRYQIFDKATGRLVSAEGEIAPSGDFSTLFSALWSPHVPAAQNINQRLDFTTQDPLPCDAGAPTRSNSCVQEFYDTRIMWDPQRRRFWIESAARNHLWFCKSGEACDGAKQTRTQARRYIAVAVSRTDDPRQGFYRYILVNQYSDWPKMAINDRYLILGHRASNTIHVFDADKLAAGNPDQGPVKLAKLTSKHFPGVKYIAPVTHHGAPSGVTYLLGSDGSEDVRVFALVNPDPNRAARPVVLAGPSVDLGTRLGTLEGNAIYRNGFLYFTWDQWAPGHEKEYRQIRLVRLPVRPNGARPTAIWSAADARYEYLNTVIGGREPDEPPGDVMNYEKPALDVNASGAAVVVYSRKAYRARVDVPPEVRYAILYHGEAQARPGVLLRRGTTSEVPDIDNNVKAGIDLAFAQVDPDERTVWVSHAWADARVRWYRHVVAAVRP